MTNLFTVKERGSLILWILVFCCLLPFVILTFLGVMASDDYTLAVLYRDYGFDRVQSILYFEWAGRFGSTFLSGLFLKFGMTARYYFIPALFLLCCTWMAIFFLVGTINRNILAQTFPKTRVLQASCLLFFVNLYTMADIASGIYWFSSAIVYQSAFILFLFLVGCLIQRLYPTDPGDTLLKDGRVILLILLITGCNEIAAVFLILFLLTIILLSYFYRRPVPAVLLVYLAMAIMAGVLITLTSGVISVRHKLMNNHTSYLSVLPIIIFRAIAVFYYILKEPLFWITSFFVWVLGARIGTNPVASESLTLFKGRNILIPGLAITLLLVIGTLTPVLLVSRGSLPLRSLNNLIALTTLCLLTIFFVTGAGNTTFPRSLIPFKVHSGLVVAILGCGLMASTNYLEAWKSVLSGYFYHAVLEDRQRLLQTAAKDHQRTVTIEPYDTALHKKIHQVFPHGIFETVNDVLLEKPRALFYFNEAEDPSPAYLHYYDVDKIIVEKQ